MHFLVRFTDVLLSAFCSALSAYYDHRHFRSRLHAIVLKHVWDQLFTVNTIWSIGETGDIYKFLLFAFFRLSKKLRSCCWDGFPEVGSNKISSGDFYFENLDQRSNGFCRRNFMFKYYHHLLKIFVLTVKMSILALWNVFFGCENVSRFYLILVINKFTLAVMNNFFCNLVLWG